jgi:hypothetical protein
MWRARVANLAQWLQPYSRRTIMGLDFNTFSPAELLAAESAVLNMRS